MELYPDLSKSLGSNNHAGAMTHYYKIGRFEGRFGSFLMHPMIYNSAQYRQYNPDLRNMTDIDLAVHWINHGIYEGRRASDSFSSRSYLQRYSDLLNAYGNTGFRNAALHFVSNGIQEGRIGN